MGISCLICKKVKVFNKWIIYISLVVTTIVVSLLPGGFDSLYVNTVLGVISFVELATMAIKESRINLFKEENDKNNEE